MVLPKKPREWHWNKKFLMPKTYLYKLHVILGYSPKKISDLHKSMLGISVSDQLVKDYLHAYKIYRSPPKSKKKNGSFLIGSKKRAANYLLHRLFIKRGVKPFLDRITEEYRKKVLNLFFRKIAKRGPITEDERNIIVFIVKNYTVSSSVIDLVLPDRKVIINWPKIEEFRQRIDIGISEFCERAGLDRSHYFEIRSRDKEAVGWRKTVRKIENAYCIHHKQGNRKGLILTLSEEISKEIRE